MSSGVPFVMSPVGVCATMGIARGYPPGRGHPTRSGSKPCAVSSQIECFAGGLGQPDAPSRRRTTPSTRRPTNWRRSSGWLGLTSGIGICGQHAWGGPPRGIHKSVELARGHEP